MNPLYVLTGIVVLGLFVYLVVALFRPEAFE
jgi:K+-transporting ATPase KdpF subunit